MSRHEKKYLGTELLVAARFELARDCSHRESRNLKSDALDQLGHATFLELCSHAYIYTVYRKWIVFTFPWLGVRATHPVGAETDPIPQVFESVSPESECNFWSSNIVPLVVRNRTGRVDS